jgi:Ras-related protein Rab-18
VPASDGAAFAARQGALFVEASAKTAVGVEAAFTDVVARILATPELWDAPAPKTGVVAPGTPAKAMPGNITLDAPDERWEAQPGGCSC